MAEVLELASCCRARLAVARLREPRDAPDRPELERDVLDRPEPEPERLELDRPDDRPELDLPREDALARPPLRPAALFCARLDVERPVPDLPDDLLALERLELARPVVLRPVLRVLDAVDLRPVLRLPVLLLRPVLADLRVVLADLRVPVLADLRVVLADLRAPVLADLRVPVLADLRAVVPADLRAVVPDDLRAPVLEDLRAVVPDDLRAVVPEDLRAVVPDDLRAPVPDDFRDAAVARPPRAPAAARFFVVESELLLLVDLRAPPLLRAPFRVVAMT